MGSKLELQEGHVYIVANISQLSSDTIKYIIEGTVSEKDIIETEECEYNLTADLSKAKDAKEALQIKANKSATEDAGIVCFAGEDLRALGYAVAQKLAYDLENGKENTEIVIFSYPKEKIKEAIDSAKVFDISEEFYSGGTFDAQSLFVGEEFFKEIVENSSNKYRNRDFIYLGPSYYNGDYANRNVRKNSNSDAYRHKLGILDSGFFESFKNEIEYRLENTKDDNKFGCDEFFNNY